MGKNVGILVRAVPEPCTVSEDGTFVVSLVLQPDDSPDRVYYGGVDVDLTTWPSEIASRLSDGSIKIAFYCDDGQKRSAPAHRLEWVPWASTSADREKRDQLWKTAIGPEILEALEAHSDPLLVAGEIPTQLRIYGSPVDKLALTAHAMASTSVFAQLAAHLSGETSVLSGSANPLAKSAQQSQSVFNLFEGARPNTPAIDDESFFETVNRERYEALNSIAEETIKRMEDYALVNPHPKPRIDPFFEPSVGKQGQFSPTRSMTTGYRRISPAMRQKLQKAMMEATVYPRDRNGRRDKRRKKPDDERYFGAAAIAFSGKSFGDFVPSKKFRESTGDMVDPGQDYANYLLSMQPDDEEVSTARSAKALSDGTDKAEAALRTVAGMYAYPSLAAFFGLIVDVALKSSDVPENALYMRAELYPHSGSLPFNSEIWTAVHKNAERLEIRARNPTGPAARVSNGLLHFNEDDRFSIISVDANAAIEGSLNSARNDYQAKLDGASNAELSSAQPAQRGVGLAIVDRWKQDSAVDEFDNSPPDPAGKLPPHQPGHDPRILCLEDLIAGCRIDVLTDKWSGSNHPWLSLMERDVEFPKLKEALANAGHDPKSLSRQPNWPVDRLGGTVQSMHREVQSNNGEDEAVIFDTLATWRNWSLAVPSMGGEVRLDEGEIQLERSVAPRPGSLPTLRFRSRVKFAARYVLINGSSVTLNDAAMHYGTANAPYVLFDGNGIPPELMREGYPVLRHEPLATPRVFLPWAPRPAGSDIDHPTRELVVHTDGEGNLKTPTASRIVLPGEASFDTAELHGALDGFNSLPQRPFTKLALTPALGKAPSNPNAVTASDAHNSLPSYPDPAVHFLVLAFTENGQPAETFGFAPPTVVGLYGGDKQGRVHRWPDAASLSLELVAAGANDLPLDGRISGDFAPSDMRREDDGRVHPKVRLLPAEQIDMTIWALPAELGDFLQHAPFVGAMHLASYESVLNTGFSSSSGEAAKLPQILRNFDQFGDSSIAMNHAAKSSGLGNEILRALRTLPIPALSSHQVVKLVHAVEKPLAVPAFNSLWVMHNPPVPDGPEDNEVRLRRAWADALVTFKLDGAEQPAAAGATAFETGEQTFSPASNRVFFGGNITFHRKSTGRLDLIGRWRDWRDDIAPRRDSNGKFQYPEEWHAEALATIDGIEYRIDGLSPDSIGLALDPKLKPSYLGHTFCDTRARKLVVNVRAVTRFRGNFKPKPNTTELQFSVSSETTAGGDKEMIVLSTERPKPLEAPFCAPSLHYTLEAYKSADKSSPTVAGLRHNRTIRMRFDLGDRFYVTGFEERVGVVCWPPDLFDAPEIPLVRKIEVDKIDRCVVKSIDTSGGGVPPEGAADFVTRWGVIPYTKGAICPR